MTSDIIRQQQAALVALGLLPANAATGQMTAETEIALKEFEQKYKPAFDPNGKQETHGVLMHAARQAEVDQRELYQRLFINFTTAEAFAIRVAENTRGGDYEKYRADWMAKNQDKIFPTYFDGMKAAAAYVQSHPDVVPDIVVVPAGYKFTPPEPAVPEKTVLAAADKPLTTDPVKPPVADAVPPLVQEQRALIAMGLLPPGADNGQNSPLMAAALKEFEAKYQRDFDPMKTMGLHEAVLVAGRATEQAAKMLSTADRTVTPQEAFAAIHAARSSDPRIHFLRQDELQREGKGIFHSAEDVLKAGLRVADKHPDIKPVTPKLPEQKEQKPASKFSGGATGKTYPPVSKKIQQGLTDLGIDPGGVDGEMGPLTRRAIFVFELTEPVSAGQTLQQRIDAALLAQDQNGMRPQNGVGDVKEWVKDIQRNLKELDYDVGNIDGDPGPKTNAALKAYLEDRKASSRPIPPGASIADMLAQDAAGDAPDQGSRFVQRVEPVRIQTSHFSSDIQIKAPDKIDVSKFNPVIAAQNTPDAPEKSRKEQRQEKREARQQKRKEEIGQIKDKAKKTGNKIGDKVEDQFDKLKKLKLPNVKLPKL